MRQILFGALMVIVLVGASDLVAADDVRAQVKRTMNAFAAMNATEFKAGLAKDVVAFEMDMENKPVRLGSRDDAMRFAEEVFSQLKKMGARTTIDFHATDCHAKSTLAWCTVELDFKATMPDGSTMSQPSQNSVVLRKGSGAGNGSIGTRRSPWPPRRLATNS